MHDEIVFELIVFDSKVLESKKTPFQNGGRERVKKKYPTKSSVRN